MADQKSDHVDEFVVERPDGRATRFDDEALAVETAKRIKGKVTRICMKRTIVNKRAFVDYDNPIEETQVWP